MVTEHIFTHLHLNYETSQTLPSGGGDYGGLERKPGQCPDKTKYSQLYGVLHLRMGRRVEFGDDVIGESGETTSRYRMGTIMAFVDAWMSNEEEDNVSE